MYRRTFLGFRVRADLQKRNFRSIYGDTSPQHAAINGNISYSKGNASKGKYDPVLTKGWPGLCRPAWCDEILREIGVEVFTACTPPDIGITGPRSTHSDCRPSLYTHPYKAGDGTRLGHIMSIQGGRGACREHSRKMYLPAINGRVYTQ